MPRVSIFFDRVLTPDVLIIRTCHALLRMVSLSTVVVLFTVSSISPLLFVTSQVSDLSRVENKKYLAALYTLLYRPLMLKVGKSRL